MVKQAVAARAIDLDPIDRLEEKVRRLVRWSTQLRAEQAQGGRTTTRGWLRRSTRCARGWPTPTPRGTRADRAARRARPHPHARQPRCCSSSRPSRLDAQDEQRRHRRDRRAALSDPQRPRRALRRRARRLRRSEDARRLGRGAGQRHAGPGRAGGPEHRRRVFPRPRSSNPSAHGELNERAMRLERLVDDVLAQVTDKQARLAAP